MKFDLVTFLGELVDPKTVSGAAFYALLFGLVAWLAGRAVRIAVHRILERQAKQVDQTAVRFLGQLARVGVWLFAFLTYARLIPALKDLGLTWLASVGVISVVVGMAAQNTLGNLISGVSLVLYRPFQIGDQVQVMALGNVETGCVENINLGYTILRTGDERRIVIPNSVIAGQTCINLSLSAARAVCSVAIALEHDASIDKAREILLALAARHPKAVDKAACSVTNLSGKGITITLTAWSTDPDSAGAMKCDILEGAVKQFRDAGVKVYREYPKYELPKTQ